MPNDYFRFKRFTVWQDRCAMKVGTDATLLGAWAGLPPNGGERLDVLDIGTGTGIIALMLAQRCADACVTGIDIDQDAAAQAAANMAASPFSSRMTVVCQPVQQFGGGPYDAITCNPPYFQGSLECPDSKRTLSRHNTSLTYDELASHVFRLLAGEGEFSMILPADHLHHMEAAAAIAGLFEKRRCYVRTKETKPPKRVMLAYAKRPQPEAQCEELTLNDPKHATLMADFYI